MSESAISAIDTEDPVGPIQARVVIPVLGTPADPDTSTLVGQQIATAWAENDPPDVVPFTDAQDLSRVAADTERRAEGDVPALCWWSVRIPNMRYSSLSIKRRRA